MSSFQCIAKVNGENNGEISPPVQNNIADDGLSLALRLSKEDAFRREEELRREQEMIEEAIRLSLQEN